MTTPKKTAPAKAAAAPALPVTAEVAPQTLDATTGEPPHVDAEPGEDAEVSHESEAAAVAGDLAQEPRYRIAARHPNGFWRCGRQWHPDGEVLTLSEIGGEAVLAVLQAEPMLVVAVEA